MENRTSNLAGWGKTIRIDSIKLSIFARLIISFQRGSDNYIEQRRRY